jgi:predicted aminopeptidase
VSGWGLALGFPQKWMVSTWQKPSLYWKSVDDALLVSLLKHGKAYTGDLINVEISHQTVYGRYTKMDTYKHQN